ncbi:MAG: chloride channel protein [Xanthomonadales bacterium]|nr:chloride channel protein [Xanthomonadales bacterium]
MIRRITVLTLLGLVIGGVVGTIAVGFVEAVLWLNDLFLISQQSRAAATDRTWLVAMTIGVPTAGGLVVGLLSLLMPGSRFQGPPDAIRTAQSQDAAMPVKSGLLSAVAACLSLGAGASVGQYGPLVHMGASLGSWIRRWTRMDRSLGRISLACGAAAAISAAFHAPIAGLVFAREVILRHYSLRAFAPIAVASTLAYVMAHIILQREPLFRIEEKVVAGAWEYLVFIVIGITGALLATVYMHAIRFAGAISSKLNWPVPIRPALAGLALGIVALQVPDVLGIGQEALRQAMVGSVYSAVDLTQILVAKLLLTALCLGFGFAGGVFSPALLIGTLFGALVGMGVGEIFVDQPSTIAIYAVCGLVAVTSPVIGAPLTTVLIVFELTQNFDLATAALVSVAFANLVGFRIFGRSLFDVQLKERGFDLSLGRDKVMVQQHTIKTLLYEDYTTVHTEDALQTVRDALVRDNRSEAYIINNAGAYVGTLSLQRLMQLVASGTELDQAAGLYAEPESVTFTPDTSIWTAMSEMKNFVGESIPVLDDGRLVGALSESTIVSAYMDILEEVRKEEHAAV